MQSQSRLRLVTTGHEATIGIPVRKQAITLDLGTLVSPTAITADSGPYAHLQGIMQKIYKDVMQNDARKKKYESFLKGAFQLGQLWKKARLPDPERRLRIFVLTYAQQRLFDDIIDGDTPVHISPKDRVLYAEERIERFMSGTLSEQEPVEAFGIKILDDIAALDPTYTDKAQTRIGLIMKSIAFDAKRILVRETSDSWQFFPKEELEQHFFDLDIDGTTGLTLFLFGLKDSPRNMRIMKPLGQLSRVAYNLQDFSDDIRAGLCNIPLEDALRLEITDDDLRIVATAGKMYLGYPSNIKVWLHEQIARGNELMRAHHSQWIGTLSMLHPAGGVIDLIRNYKYRQFVKHKVLGEHYVNEAKEVFAEF